MRSADNALELLELVAQMHPVGVTDVARRAGLPKSTAQRTLESLAGGGWIERDDDSRWRPAARALLLAMSLDRQGDAALPRLAAPVLERLHRSTEESIHLVVPDGPDVVLVERLPSPRAITVQIPAGVRIPLHWCATGKAILAALPAGDVADIVALDRPVPATGEPMTPAELHRRLDEVRRQGWSTNHGEWNSEVRAVAAAIVDRDDRPVAAVSISCPPHRLEGDLWTVRGAEVQAAAAEISALLRTP